MATDPSDIMLYRIEPAKNMRRFYSVTIQPNLFGGHSLIRSWGRIGTTGQNRIDLFEGRVSAQRASDNLLRSKRKRGYSTLC